MKTLFWPASPNTLFNPSFQSYFLTTFFLMLGVSISNSAYAHNGSVCYAHPMSKVTIDGDLTDWPQGMTIYPVELFDGNKPDHERDCKAQFRVGYALDNRSIYIGVEIIDDDYVLSPDNPRYDMHDLQVLYLDPAHTVTNSGVIAYELSEDNRKIVHQEEMQWYPQVKNASWDNVEVKIKREGDRTVYEWRIALGERLVPGHSIGFDYVFFDKDTDEGFKYFSWGAGGMKFANFQSLGDLVLVPAAQEMNTISGRLSAGKDEKGGFPPTVTLECTKPEGFWLKAMVDSTGYYQAKVPVGTYTISVPNKLVLDEEEENPFRVTAAPITDFVVKSGKAMELPTITLNKTFPRDMLPAKGILHNFNAAAGRQVDEYVTHLQRFYDIPGVSLALIKDGDIVYYKTYGVQNEHSQVPVEESSLFEAASVTKSVFAYVVNRLAERGVIDLDKPLHEYLPFEAMEKFPDYKLMTGRHVLTHRTGLPNWGIDLKFKPGTDFGYSGEGFEYLKRVVMHITGKEITEVLKEELIEPNGLYNMHFSQLEKGVLEEHGVSGHYDAIPSIQFYPEEPGMAWSMFTEAKAFTGFAKVIMERKGLKPETFKSFLEIHTETPEWSDPDSPYKQGFGLGIAVRETPYGIAFGHGGNNGDFECMYEMYDDLKMGYIVFTNSNVGDFIARGLPELLVEGKKKKK